MKIKQNETYAEFIKRIRQTMRLTQEDFAVRNGFCRRSIALWESGREPSLTSKRIIDEFASSVK